MTDQQKPLKTAAWVVAMWLLAHIVLIGGHVLLVALYSVAVAPGLEHADYQAFAERSAPGFSILAGAPVFYVVGRVLRRRAQPNGRRAGLATWGLYTATDAAIALMALSTITPYFAGLWLTSQGVKLLAVLMATRSASPTG